VDSVKLESRIAESSVVNIPPVSDGQNEHSNSTVFDFVDDSVIANPDSVAV